MESADDPQERKVGCPSESDLLSFHLGTLADTARVAAVRAHWSKCAECRSTLRDLADEAEFRDLLGDAEQGMNPLARKQILDLALRRWAEVRSASDPRA